MLPSFPVSILHGTVILLLPVCISNFAVSINRFLFICTDLILTVSISPLLYSWDISSSISFIALLLLVWQTFLKCPISLHPAHVLSYARHCLGWCIPPQYLHGCHCVVWLEQCLVLCSFLIFLLYQTAFTLLACLKLLPGPSVLLPSLPMPGQHTSTCYMVIIISHCQFFYNFLQHVFVI